MADRNVSIFSHDFGGRVGAQRRLRRAFNVSQIWNASSFQPQITPSDCRPPLSVKIRRLLRQCATGQRRLRHCAAGNGSRDTR